MPAGPRQRFNNVYGLTTDNPLTAGAVTYNSPGLANMGVVSSAHAVVTLDPLREFGEPEIVVVTSHTASATVATITRGQYGTVARSHPLGTTWVHAPLDEDFIEVLTAATRPSNPYRGQFIYETDNDKPWSWTGAEWEPQVSHYACRVYGVAQQIFGIGTTQVDYDTVTYDETSAFNLVTNSYVVPQNGLYGFTAQVIVDNSSTANILLLTVRLGGVEIARGMQISGAPVASIALVVASEYPALTGNTFDVGFFVSAVGGVNRIDDAAFTYLNYFTVRRVASHPTL